MEIQINVVNQNLKVTTNPREIVEGSQNFVAFKFTLDESWDGLLPFAQFTQGSNAYNVYLDKNNIAYLPPEITHGKFTLMLYGAAGNVRGTTTVLEFEVKENKLIGDAQSIEITQSLYDQLVQKVNELLDLSNSDYSELIVQSITNILNEAIQNGDLGELTIADGSVTKSKLASDVTSSLTKADTAMQPSVYDPNGIRVDVFDYAAQRATEVNTRVTGIANELGDAYTIGDGVKYTKIGDALRGGITRAVNLANSHTDAALADYSAFSVIVTDTLPARGEERTFYLVPKANGKGYDKYWWIIDEDGTPKYDTFGSSSTIIVSQLPSAENAEEDVDYILADGGDYQYYKWINSQWALIAGSTSIMVGENLNIMVIDHGTPAQSEYDPAEYYNIGNYLDLDSMKLYKVKEIIEAEISYEWDEGSDLFTNLSETKDYFVYYAANEIFMHFRYIDGSFKMVGNVVYTKEEIDNLLSSINNNIQTNRVNISSNTTNISSLNRAVDKVAQDLATGLSNIESLSYSAELIKDDDDNYKFRLIEIDGDTETEKSSFILPSGGGGGGSGQTTTTIMNLERTTASPVICTPNDSVVMVVQFTAVDDQNEPVDCTYTIKRGSYIVETGNMIQGENKFDLTDYCQTGTQKFTITVTDGIGTSSIKSLTVQVVDVWLESLFNDQVVYPIGSSVGFSYIPHGAISKTVHFKLDGVELESYNTAVSGTSQSYLLPPQSHGAHLLECWMTAKISNVNIETAHIFKDIIWYDETSTLPVIGCIYRYVHYGEVPSKQYNTTQIPYVVYDPQSSMPRVELRVDDEVVDSFRMNTNQSVWAYKESEIAVHKLEIVCGDTVAEIHVDVQELGYDIEPITANLAFDFNPVGYTNSSVNKLWVDKNHPDIKMTVSDNFDWNNGGYQLDSDGNQYFCIKVGTRAYINYQLFGVNPINTGNEFKIVFKTVNVADDTANFLNCVPVGNETKVGIEMNTHDATIYASSKSITLAYSEEDIIEFDYNINPIEGLNEDPNATSFVMTYEDGVAYRAMMYKSEDRLYQYDPGIIEIGSDKCDVHIYRMKAYSSSLSYDDIMSNFIADARNAETMIARYERNQIYDENGYLDPEHLAKVCPDLRIIMLDAPYFTNDKKDYVKNTNVRCIYENGDPILDNWQFRNGYHAGQGTTSNRYGLAGRNIDIIFGFDGQHQVVSKIKLDPNYITELTLGDGTQYLDGHGKVALTRTSVPNDWFNIKVNIASSDNANNALLQKRYNDYLPYKTPAMKRNPFIKNSMEFVNCVVFIKETDDDLSKHREFADKEWHFYAIGNLGDSKKTDNTRVNDPTDLKEFVVEISDNTLINATFDTGVYIDNQGNETYEYQNGYSIKYPITKQQWEATDGYIEVDDPTYLNDENMGLFYEKNGNNYTLTTDKTVNTSKTYYQVNYLNSKYKGLYITDYVTKKSEDGEVSYVQKNGWDASFEFRYDMGTKDGQTISSAEIDAQQELSKQVFRNLYEFIITSTDEEFVSNFGDWFITESPLYWYLFTERYTMMDNRAKNSFWHWGKTYITKEEAAEMGDDAKNYIIDDVAANINEGYRCDLWNYDDDTALGIDNNGEMNRSYGLEDIDRLPNGVPVFNASDSVFWRRIRKLMGAQLKAMYLNRESLNCWRASSLITEFDNWQNQFPEELWKLDIERKYIRPYLVGNPLWVTSETASNATDDFLKNMMNGRKRYQRRQFERNQEIYIGTKYFGLNQCSDSTSISFRCNTPKDVVVPPDYTLKVVPYSDMYLSVVYGNSTPQTIRAKAGVEYTFETDMTTMDETIVLIYCGQNIMALNDLSAFYIHANEFSYATKLKTLIIGNDTPGYENTKIETISLGRNALLETLDIRNCPNLTGSVNLSYCTSLQTLYAEGTSISSVTFAPNGNIQTAHLPATISSLAFRNITKLTDLDVASYDNLETLIVEYSNLDTLAILQETIDTLYSVRILGINWVLPETDLLNQIASKRTSLLSGYANISGSIRNRELDTYREKWPDLEVDYNPNNLVSQYEVRFLNSDGSLLYEPVWVDSGSTVTDPISEGKPTPTKAPDAQYTYEFDCWTYVNDNGNTVEGLPDTVYNNMDITAKYTETTRTYRVRFFLKEGASPLRVFEDQAYGSEVVYDLDTPTDKSGEAQNQFKIFTGWDKSTGFIEEDLDVYAQWDSYNGIPASTIKMNEMTPAQIYAICQRNMQGNRFKTLDYVDILLGNDYNFSNVKSVEFSHKPNLDQTRDSDGNLMHTADYMTGITPEIYHSDGFYFDGNSGYLTDIHLFSEDAPAFTMAIDFQFSEAASNSVLLTTGTTADGIRLYCSGTTPTLQWGDTSCAVGENVRRNMLVIRHPKGENRLIAYYLRDNGNPDNPTEDRYGVSVVTHLLYRTTELGDKPLSFGAEFYNDGFRNNAHGFIHWCKIWYNDLGEDVAKMIAVWPRMNIRMEYWGKERYYYAASTVKSKASFIANSEIGTPLGKGYWMNRTAVNYPEGWKGSLGRKFCNEVIYYAYPQVWRSIMRKVDIISTAGNRAITTVTSEDYIYLPSYKEAANGSGNGYNDEIGVTSDIIPWFSQQANPNYTDGSDEAQNVIADAMRAKWRGRQRLYPGDEGFHFYQCNSEPSGLYNKQMTPGALWRHTGNSNNMYMFVSADEIERYNLTPQVAVADSRYTGGWFIAAVWWFRSPYTGGTFYFWHAQAAGAPANYYASNVYGIAPGFSI